MSLENRDDGAVQYIRTHRPEAPWNRCDVCGRFIALEDFGNGAVRYCVTPDSHRSSETWETLCIKHASER